MSVILSDKKLINAGDSESQTDDDEQSMGQPIDDYINKRLAAEVSDALDWPEDKKKEGNPPPQQAPPPTPQPPPPATNPEPPKIIAVPPEPASTAKSDPNFIKLYDKHIKWSKKLDNPDEFKKQLDTATTIEKLNEIYHAAQKILKRLKDKKRREEKKKENQKPAVSKDAAEESESEDDDDEEEKEKEATEAEKPKPFQAPAPIETLKEVQERLDREDRLKKEAEIAAEINAALEAKKKEEEEKVKQAAAAKAVVVASPAPTKKRSRSKKEPEPELGVIAETEIAKRAKTAETTESTVAVASVTAPPPPPSPAKPADPPPPLDVLRYVFGSKFVVNLAQSLIDKGAASVVGSLAQQTFLTNLADSTIAILRPDLADEANDVTSKSSSVADKETVRALRQINAAPKNLSAVLKAKRVSEIGNSKLSGDMAQLVGFASMAAAGALLNATVVANPERTKAVIAMATAEYNKNDHALAILPLISHEVMPPLIIDPNLSQNWRLATNRYTVFDCTDADFSVIRWTTSDPPGAAQPLTKRVRIDESQNTTSDKTPFIWPIKIIGSFGLAAADNDRVFKYNATPVLKNRCDIMSIMPNKTMMSLFSMIYESLNTPEHVYSLLSPIYNKQSRPESGRASVPVTYRKTNPVAAMFSCICDTNVADLPKRYFEVDNRNLPYSVQQLIVLNSRHYAELYVAKEDKNALVKPLLEYDIVIAHVIFSFIRLDSRVATFLLGETAYHPAARVVSSARDNAGTEVLMGFNELPVGVSVRVPDISRRVLLRMWQRWLTHLGLWNEKTQQIGDVTHDVFVTAYENAKFGENQWMVDYFKKTFTPTDEQRLLFREALLPVMFSLFPPGFMGAVPDKK